MSVATLCLALLAHGASASEAEMPATRLPAVITPAPATVFLTKERFELKSGRLEEAERGLIFLPADRTSSDARVVAVEFYRFSAQESTSSSSLPIFELEGGPGFGGLSSRLERAGYFERWIEPFTRVADYVVVGQRGFGANRPYLRCGESEEPIFDDTLPYDQRMAAAAAASADCRRFWESRGISRHSFNVREAAADVAEVARTLGYERITLWGNSFGSHWAMAVMRYHGELVARAVLGGIEGPDQTYDLPQHVLGALARVAAEAERSTELQPFIPDGGLLAALETVVRRLRDQPVVVEAEDQETGLVKAVRVTHLIAQSVAEDGYSDVEEGAHPMSAWPADVLEMYHADYRGLAREARDERIEGLDYIPSAGYFLYDCASGISRERRQRLEADPAMAVLGQENWLYEGACPVWDVDLGEDFRTGFFTDVPTVIVQGTWDTSTPLENALELLPSFTNVHFIPIERGTHGALHSPFRDGAPEDVQQLGRELLRFLVSGDASRLPDSVTLPEIEWKLPHEKTALRDAAQ